MLSKVAKDSPLLQVYELVDEDLMFVDLNSNVPDTAVDV